MRVRAIHLTNDRDKRAIVQHIDMRGVAASVSQADAPRVADLWLRGTVEVGAVPYRERYQRRHA